MADAVDYTYSSDSCSSETESEVSSKHRLDWSYTELTCSSLAQNLRLMISDQSEEQPLLEHYQSLKLRNNRLAQLPEELMALRYLRFLDISSNQLESLPDSVVKLQHLTSLVCRNNLLTDAGLPKELGRCRSLREVHLGGNQLTRFPSQLLELDEIKFVYLGANSISELPRELGRLQKLRVLYLGGNRLTEVPAEVGQLVRLQVLVLSENQLHCLPPTVAQLKKLRTLLLHKNQLTTLPPQIVTLQGLMELSLRDNPLVVRFVRDLTYKPPSLLELAARVVKSGGIAFQPWDLPKPLTSYLDSAHQCVNPKCQGEESSTLLTSFLSIANGRLHGQRNNNNNPYRCSLVDQGPATEWEPFAMPNASVLVDFFHVLLMCFALVGFWVGQFLG